MALATTSFPVPVSPWIKTAESTGATLSTSAINARNFGLEPIKSKAVIDSLLYESDTYLLPCRRQVHPYSTSIIEVKSKADNYRFIYSRSCRNRELFRVRKEGDEKEGGRNGD